MYRAHPRFIGPNAQNLMPVVTLSEAKGLTRGAARCFAVLSMTKCLIVTLSGAKGLIGGAARCFAVLSMTKCLIVTLSEAKGLIGGAARCFAECTLSEANVLGMIGWVSSMKKHTKVRRISKETWAWQ